MSSAERAASVRRPPPPVPVVVLTGFLGAGKTTLLNELLHSGRFANTVVLINEFGEIGLDHLLIERVDGDMLLLASGCLCCTIRGDLVNALEGLLRRLDNGRIAFFDRVVIETTGLADPVPILQTILGHPYLSLRFRLDRVVTVVDAVNGHATLARHREAVRQVALADRLVVTKADLPEAQTEKLRAELRDLNTHAPIVVRVRESDAGGDLLLDDTGIGLGLAGLPHDHASALHDHDHHHEHGAHAHDRNRHSEAIRAFTLVREAPLTATQLSIFVELLRHSHGPKLLRLKALVAMADDPERPLLLQAVQHILHPPVRLDRWPDADQRTRIVLIGDGLDEASVARLFGAVCGDVAPDQPDLSAMTANPLAGPPAGGLLG